MRYRRQAYELTVPIADGRDHPRQYLDALAEAFHAKHEQTYGHANRAEPVQLVNLRLTALGRLPALTLAQRGDAAAARACASATFGSPRPGSLRRRCIGAPGWCRARLIAGPGDHRGAGFDDRRAAGLARGR